jgi:hypothetical protein
MPRAEVMLGPCGLFRIEGGLLGALSERETWFELRAFAPTGTLLGEHQVESAEITADEGGSRRVIRYLFPVQCGEHVMFTSRWHKDRTIIVRLPGGERLLDTSLRATAFVAGEGLVVAHPSGGAIRFVETDGVTTRWALPRDLRGRFTSVSVARHRSTLVLALHDRSGRGGRVLGVALYDGKILWRDDLEDALPAGDAQPYHHAQTLEPCADAIVLTGSDMFNAPYVRVYDPESGQVRHTTKTPAW